jgi:hypothetical protein
MVGQKWYQSIDIDGHLAADVLFSNLKGHHPLNTIKPVFIRYRDRKLAF